ncbi:MAG TPA: ectoine/hydroxyectoine ABC transporter permease subunit EhuC [Rhizobiaceae bacterium]|nr:ectoine/hydroxyectoine ABC transporter permease subunit EhuC [Rhizobiaceae bacterium]
MDLLQPMVTGAAITVVLTIASSAVAVLCAVVAGLARLSRSRPVRWLAVGYVEFFRGSSMLVQLFWLYFVLPHLGMSLSPITAGILGIGLNAGAYGAEMVRSAILAVPKGQYEAAIALNMSPFTRFWRIIAPQALAIMLPAWGNNFINILKATSLVSLITIHDLTYVGTTLNAMTYRTLEIFGAILIIYYVLGRWIIVPGMRYLERRATAGILRAVR